MKSNILHGEKDGLHDGRKRVAVKFFHDLNWVLAGTTFDTRVMLRVD